MKSQFVTFLLATDLLIYTRFCYHFENDYAQGRRTVTFVNKLAVY